MLRELMTILSERGLTSLLDLSLSLKKDPQTISMALQQLERKGRVEKVEILPDCKGGCKGCLGCQKERTIFYKLGTK